MLILLFNCVTISNYGMGDYMTIAKSNNKSVTKKFVRYVSQNVLGMIGMSLYILADTFFISESVGANGITALNIVLPIYSFIFAKLHKFREPILLHESYGKCPHLSKFAT